MDIKRKTCNFCHQVGGFVDKFKEGSDNVRDQIENAGEQIDRFCLKVGHSWRRIFEYQEWKWLTPPYTQKLWTDKVLLNPIVRTLTAFYLSNIATTLPTRWLNKDTYLAICWTTITSSQYTFTAYAIKHCQKHSGLSALFAWVIQPFIHITIRNFFSIQITHLLSLHDFSSTLSHDHVKLNTNTFTKVKINISIKYWVSIFIS